MYFCNKYKSNSKLQACLSRFIPIFAAASRKNQTLLADVFISIMNKLKVLNNINFILILYLL